MVTFVCDYCGCIFDEAHTYHALLLEAYQAGVLDRARCTECGEDAIGTALPSLLVPAPELDPMV